MNILVIDVGGTHVKLLASGQTRARRFDSGPALTPFEMVQKVKGLVGDWPHSAISIGYPGVVAHDQIMAEPNHLGPGWVGFDFGKAFDLPVRIINDAAMQALGSYEDGRMLFLGLGTGLGSALIAEGRIDPLELGRLPYRKGRTYEDYLGAAGMKRLGKTKWRRHVWLVVDLLRGALEADSVVLGGGNAVRLKELPSGVRLVENANAFIGGFRLWQEGGIQS